MSPVVERRLVTDGMAEQFPGGLIDVSCATLVGESPVRSVRGGT